MRLTGSTSHLVLTVAFGLVVFGLGCKKAETDSQKLAGVIKPVVVPDTVRWDTDDPATWINPDDPLKSLMIGTDKDTDGALYVFDLDGK